ncbi:sensor histidine kinase [Photobacterium gaetbulicola]|uniref:sensor histidine kinase n=1 Tax=Photobacterium gaetbulicola TaxID=1295392 RepID=UPI00068CDBDD|nr:two-component sensor histidine kinase [Photobacterium gaetbulicola]
MAKDTDSKPKTYPSIYRKIRWSFGIPTLIMFTLFWSVIYLAENELEIISLHHWLDTEASRYSRDYQRFGDQAQLPNESEFYSYWSKESPPAWLDNYREPGFYEHLLGKEDKHFLVTEHPSGDGLFYIVFQDDADDYLDEYEARLHFMTFSLGGAVSLAVLIYSWYFVKSVSRPLETIEHKIRNMPPDQPDFMVETDYKETREIEQALHESKVNIARYFQREHEFSRFASHELRTPIMVIQGSAELLGKVPNQPPVAIKAINRLQQASEEMRELTEAFLLLGKEHIDRHHFGSYSLDENLRRQLDAMAPIFAKQDASYVLETHSASTISAPESFINIVINNLIKNAFNYSVGDIQIRLVDNQLTITNYHDGHATFNAGYGCGLVIVERICERMGWQFTPVDDSAKFTTTLVFTSPPNARSEEHGKHFGAV